MAYELNESYQTPSYISWVKRTGTNKYDTADAWTNADIMPTVVPYRIAFKSYHGNFQLQYCIRRRKAPWKASQDAGSVTYTDPDTGQAITESAYDGEDIWVPWTGTLSNGSEASSGTWTDSAGRTWGPWQGNALSSSSPQPSDVKLLTKSQVDGWRVYNLDMPFPYELTYNGHTGYYDRTEYRVRVRAFNASQNGAAKWNYGHWGEAVIGVSYVPIVVDMQGQREADGSVTVVLESNYQHSVSCAAIMPLAYDLSPIEPETSFHHHIDPTVANTYLGDFAFSVPELYAPKPEPYVAENDKLRFQTMTIFPDDFSMSYVESYDSYWKTTETGQAYIEFPVHDHIQQNPVPEPDITVGAGGTITVTPSSGDYSNLLTRVYWVDGDGKQYLSNVTMNKKNGVWKGKIDTPPIGVDIDVRVTVVDSATGDWITRKKTTRVNSNASFMLDGKDIHFELKYNVTFSEDASREVEYVKVDGRNREVSRYARVCSVSHTVEGDIINPATGYQASDAWQKQIDTLKKAGDLWMRKAGGVRRRVSVESVATSSEYPNNSKFMHVTITLREVS